MRCDPEKSKGVVSSATPEASEAGVQVLREGGNAVDAAVAVSFVLGVTEPAGSGIGGQSTLIMQVPYHMPAVINGTSHSPKATQTDFPISEIARHKASTVPTTIRTMEFAWERYGSGKISWERLVAPAVEYARNGYPLGEFRHKALMRYHNFLKKEATVKPLLLNPDGSVPTVGTVVKNEFLADTLERIGKKGAIDFYSGEIANLIARDMEANNGWISIDDLKEVRQPSIMPALNGSYRSWHVASLPPPASGWAVIMALNFLETADKRILETNPVSRTLWMVKALRTVHRHRLYSPIQNLVHFEDSVHKKISKERAERLAASFRKLEHGETTHFSIVDRDHMAVGVTQSLNAYYGARVASPELGFLYNSYMQEFVSGHRNNPFALNPNAMPYSSMSASILSKDFVPKLVLGSPANERIISAVIQVISHWVDVEQGIEAAVNAPRIHTGSDEEIMIETLPDDTRILLALEKRGYTLYQPLSSLFTKVLNPYFGGVHAIAYENSIWKGAADARRDGCVAYE
ncbi:MAG: hypothetical protein D3926_01110 [Desulfobacteraceae bacterium]|nr:MAG: hypothetical protein D3926_01110 [Desulfobacteraceae bacterium]